jgi:hypothetical protein
MFAADIVAMSVGGGGRDWLDCALRCLFLLGLYPNYTIRISAKVPFPSMPSGCFFSGGGGT